MHGVLVTFSEGTVSAVSFSTDRLQRQIVCPLWGGHAELSGFLRSNSLLGMHSS